MKSAALSLVLFSATVCLLLTFKTCVTQGQSCTNQWFGTNCKYKCHCIQGNSYSCGNNGMCADGFKCESGWFGPACQYADLVSTSNILLTPNNITDYWLTDGNDSTCNENANLQSVTLDLDTPNLFTWMRINVKDAGSQNLITVQFKWGGNTTHQNCVNEKSSVINNKTVHIHCEMSKAVTQVVLSGNGVKTLCSVHISGGRNVALNQSATQSSTYHSASNNPLFAPSLAVDGNTNGFVTNSFSTCTHTNGDSTTRPAYWVLTFQQPHLVYRYIVYNRQDEGNGVRIKGFILEKVEKNNHSQIVYEDNRPDYNDPYKILNTEAKLGVIQVKISVDNDKNILTLCEVEIYGDCLKGSYGLACNQQCSQNCGGDGSCQLLSGDCLFGCKSGYHRSHCNSSCEEGWHGVGCSEQCSGNCADDRECNHVNGTCLSGCKPGYDGDLCNNTCTKGWYGLGCKQECSENCAGDNGCDHVNGTCLFGCEPGYRGNLCNNTCEKGWYGLGCSQQCGDNCAGDGDCNHVNGTCLSGCKPGNEGNLCNSTCKKDWYGVACSQQCSENCAGDGDCNHINGTCVSGCTPGYEGDLCSNTCEDYKYGDRCNLTCSENCAGNQTCSPVNGTCNFGCNAGYTGSLCKDKCFNGSYGEGCKSNCSEHCADDGSCKPVTGECIYGCEAGYDGLLCNEACESGRYGARCGNLCQNCAGDEGCHPINGTCLSGCVAGYYLTEGVCQESLKGTDEGSTQTAAIIGSVMAVIVIAVLVFLGVMLWRRKRRPNSEEQHLRSQPDGGETMLTISDAERQHPKPEEGAGIYYNTLPALEPRNTAIAVDKLGAFLFSHDREFFEEQFNSVPTTTSAVTTIGLNDENRHKNRYKNICAYDHSRVVLQANPKKNQGDYINASYVGGYNNEEKFIASQGPSNIVMEDFLRMLWEQKVEKVVMLTNLIEEGKSKCDKYWPEEGDINFGDFKVTLATTQVFADYTIRNLQLGMETCSTVHEFTHYHFTTWPDKGVPVTPWGLVDFEQRVFFTSTTKPIAVHCSAGVGRTGTFIALRNIMREAKRTDYVDFCSTLRKLRQDRISMIQNLDQYIFLHRAAQIALVCIETTMTAENITEWVKILEEKSARGETNLQKEFKEICSLCTDYMEANEEKKEASEIATSDVYDEDSLSEANKAKNRFCDVLPKKLYRPYLQSKNEIGSYINAVQVQSFTKQHQNILTQLPLPTTITDFWNLVIQYNVTLIVAFELDSKSTDETIGNYLPSIKEEPFSDSHFNIKKESDWAGNLWTVQQLSVTTDQTHHHKVTHVMSTFTDLDPEKLLALVIELRARKPPGDSRTIFMCRNGAEYSGLACVLSLLLDRMDNDNCLAVPLVVGAIKSVRPQVIPSLKQYETLYKVLQKFNETTSVYCNFGQSKSGAPKVESFQENEKVYANI